MVRGEEAMSGLIGYEEAYHVRRHQEYLRQGYYEARAEIAKEQYLKNIAPSAAVLEYGCGFGQNIFLVNNAIGYDISRFAIARCREHGVKATDTLGDIAEASMDVALSAHVLEHHPEPLTMLLEIGSKLRPAGKLILALPYERHRYVGADPDLNQHLYAWTFRTINNLLARAGFIVRSNRYAYGWGYGKLLFCRRWGFTAYLRATQAVGVFTGTKELIVVAERAASRQGTNGAGA
jgi:SAM-dependent methyltransferase